MRPRTSAQRLVVKGPVGVARGLKGPLDIGPMASPSASGARVARVLVADAVRLAEHDFWCSFELWTAPSFFPLHGVGP